MWYLIAVVIGLILWITFERLFFKHTVGAVVILLAAGIILDEYHILFNNQLIDKISVFTNECLGGVWNVFLRSQYYMMEK